jgi:hypothetical protein
MVVRSQLHLRRLPPPPSLKETSDYWDFRLQRLQHVLLSKPREHKNAFCQYSGVGFGTQFVGLRVSLDVSVVFGSGIYTHPRPLLILFKERYEETSAVQDIFARLYPDIFFLSFELSCIWGGGGVSLR